MPYFAPPGGAFTSRVARQLQDSSMQGLEVLPSINVRMPRILPAAIGAARRARFGPPAAEETTMTGMGIVTTPGVRHPRYAVPAPVIFSASQAAARIAAARSMSFLSAAARRPVPIRPPMVTQAFPAAAGTQRQAAMFMQPGGGYSQIPGFMPAIGPPMRRLAGLGQEEPTMIPAPDVLIPPPDIFTPRPITLIPTPPLVDVQPTTYTAPTTLVPPTGPLAVQAVPLPPGLPPGAYVSRPQFLPSTGPGAPSFMNASTLGVPNKYLIAGVAMIVIVTGMAGRRRRNPRRHRAR